MKYHTEQEQFWAQGFGVDYIKRNAGNTFDASNSNLLFKALARTRSIKSCIEFGANIGLNLRALKNFNPNIDLFGVEINEDAVSELSAEISQENIFHESIINFIPKRKWDLVLVKGVLIHINPEYLGQVYKNIASAADRYVLIAEYYNPTPVSVPYRGFEERLFKRDFAGEFLELFPEFKLQDYGFVYRRDLNFPQDDITWFLLEKVAL